MIQWVLDLITDLTWTDYWNKASLYFRIRNDDWTFVIKKVNVTENTQISIFEKFSWILHNKLRPYEAEPTRVVNINNYDYTNTDKIYYFENTEIEDNMQFLSNDHILNTDLFTANQNHTIEWVIIRIWSTDQFINLYVPYFPIYGLNRDKWFIIREMDDQFTSDENEETIRFNYNISFIYHNNKLLVLDFQKLEKEFWYDEVLNTKAQNKVDVLNWYWLLSDNATLNSLVESDKSVRNKLLKIKDDSPVFSVPVNDLINFIRSKPLLNKFTIVDNKFTVDNKSKALLFLKIIDDDFVKSELTWREYDAEKKSNLE